MIGKWPVDSSFHPDNVGPVTVIMLQRVYDLLAVIAYEADPDAAEKVIAFHRAGQLLSPPPSYIAEEPASDEDY